MRADSEITGLFADEGGKHYLISLAENGGSTHSVYYLQPSYKKPKLLSKLKGPPRPFARQSEAVSQVRVQDHHMCAPHLLAAQ